MTSRRCRIWPIVLFAYGILRAASPANGQASAGVVPPADHTHAQAALKQLQDGDVASALETLGTAADTIKMWHPTQDAGLSAAAGGLFRSLTQLDADEQYDRLYEWSMPTDARKTVRLLTTMVPLDAPPPVFARALGERPRDSSFAVAEINGVRGLFSSGWLLVQAADDVGRLRRLIGELEPLAADNVPNADVLLLLARIADARGDVSELSALLERRAKALRDAIPQPAAAIDPSHVVLAAAALKHEPLRPLCEEIFDALVEHTYGGPAAQVRPFLRVAHATAIQLNRGESGPEVLYRNRLKYWVPVSGKTSALNARGAVDAMWLVHEDHILHLAGAGNDVLFLRFPLTGEFDFTCETQEGGRIATDGGLVYGGLQFEALGSSNQLTVWDADIAHSVRKPCPFVRHEDRPTFNRVSIRSTAEGAKFAANLHPVWFDNSAAQRSPWIGLRSLDERRPIFRNFKITGKPVIPRKVHLFEGDQLRGWQSNFFGERQPPFAAAAATALEGDVSAPAAEFDWVLSAGVIHAARREAKQGVNPQSLLRYQRPLLDGEAISYEFHYEPGAYEVHPALGRMAFLIEPAGVRIHWMTDGEREWTGLPEDNVTLEPLSRRGPRPLPLKEKDWNTVTVSRADGKVAISLNGELIYERPVDFGGDHLFGFYRDRTRSAVRVRNVVMTGDWPEALPKDFLENPATVIEEPQARADRRMLNAQIGPEFVAENVRHVRREAADLPSAERFEFLCGWVLPGSDHGDIRVAGEFTQTNPSPFAIEREGAGAGSAPAERSIQSQRGAELVSPAFDLLDLAADTGRLEELRDKIAAIPKPGDELNRRAQAALLALIHLDLKESQAAETALETLLSLADQPNPVGLYEQWPETLVVYRGIDRFAGNAAVGDLLTRLYTQRTLRWRWTPGGIENWHTQIASLMGRYLPIERGGSQESSAAAIALDNWVPTVRARARSRGDGHAHAQWFRQEDNEVHHLNGHQEEYLLYRSPLRGDFEVECDIGAYSVTQFLAGGTFFGPRASLNEFETGTFRGGSTVGQITPPFSKFDRWVRCRVVFRDGTCTAYLNGREVRSEQLPEHYDPWIGARSWWRNPGRFRDVRITGNPEVPDAVVLSASKKLVGWLPYHEETAGWDTADWKHMDAPQSTGQIVRLRNDALAGTFFESLLRYHRPLVEDGAIEYDFYYEPQRAETHPALDRLAFLLDPAGVRVHSITDGPYDRTELPPDNAFDEPQNRRGPDRLPLKPAAWNHMKLSVAGDTVTLELNGQLIHERQLEATNQRTFGLFGYADKEVRVRNVVMRGDWPKTVPPGPEQELASQLVDRLDADLARLKSVFRHDFASDGLPGEFFSAVNSDNRGGLTLRREGIGVTRPAIGSWAATSLRLNFAIHGDFDVEAAFEQFQGEGDKDSCAVLVANVDDDNKTMCRVTRVRGDGGLQRLHTAMSLQRADGNRAYSTTSNTSSEATAGRLRMTRRGDVVHYLFAENDSDVFRVLHSEVISDSPIRSGEAKLQALCNGTGEARVVWKTIRLAAEELLLPPDPSAQPRSVLFVMNADGSKLSSITDDVPGEFSHGSPDWSPDGKQIAFDVWSGRAETSHAFLINADGTGLKDLGIGAMPTFSPDGRRLAFTWGGRGMAIMDTDGGNRQVVTEEGWGAQWSPDGRWIAYESRHRTGSDFSANITIIDVKTKEKRLLLEGDQQARYSQIYWNMEWSPDSRRICFKGNVKDAGTETAITSVDGSAKDLQVLTTDNVSTDFSWHPDGSRILLSMHSKEHAGSRLFVCELATRQIALLKTQPTDQVNSSGVWSPDGRRIVFVSRREPEPVPWQSELTKRGR